MVNITKLWTGAAQHTDSLRYGMGRHPGHPGGHTASARKPITVWNITLTCNLRCVHCYSDSNALSYPGELTWPEMENVIDDLSAYQVPSLLLSGGEPLPK
jgi:sulfatase maturation enzyme AslB (radical SAM superfamily)